MVMMNSTVSFRNTTNIQFHNVEILPPWLHWLLNALMVLTTLVGMTGNGLVCFFFLKKKVKLSSFNILLLNLSVADLMADIFAYPHIFVDLKMLRSCTQSQANILCAFTIGNTPFAVVSGVSVLTLAYISLNRFISVQFPFKAKWLRSRKSTCIVLVSFWLFCLVFTMPNIFSFHYDAEFALCYRDFPSAINVTAWNAIGVFLALVVPITVMLLSFFFTVRRFKRMDIPHSSAQLEVLKKKKRAVKLLGFLILFFFACWGPSLIYLLLSMSVTSIWPKAEEGQYVRMKVIRVTFLITLTNTIADPVIYGYFNNGFRECFKGAFQGVKGKISFWRATAESTGPDTNISEIEKKQNSRDIQANTFL